MTARERLLAALDGRPVDRPPVWLLFPYHYYGAYVDVRTHPDYRPIFEESKRHAVMLNRRHLGAPLFQPGVQTRNEEAHEGDWTVSRRTLSADGITLISETRRRPGEHRIKPLLNTEDDLRAFARLPIETDRVRITAALDAQLPAYRAEQAEFPLDYGAMMLDLGEPVNTLYFSSNLEEYAVWSLSCPDVVESILERLMEQKRIVYDYCLERNLADVYFLVGSELASPPLVSRATFQRWIVPYARELIARIHAAGARVIQHYHGQIREILADFVEMGADGLHTIEAPPTGNCTMTQAYAVTGDRLTLIGNIQYDCFRSYTPAEMAAAVKALLAECRGRRFILSPTAGPYEQDLDPRIAANYLAFMRAASEG